MVEMAPGDVSATYADVSHARERLGYSPSTSIEMGLHRFIECARGAGREVA